MTDEGNRRIRLAVVAASSACLLACSASTAPAAHPVVSVAGRMVTGAPALHDVALRDSLNAAIAFEGFDRLCVLGTAAGTATVNGTDLEVRLTLEDAAPQCVAFKSVEYVGLVGNLPAGTLNLRFYVNDGLVQTRPVTVLEQPRG